MAELLEAVTYWPSLALVVAVVGFAPGFCLRLIVLAYPRGASDTAYQRLSAGSLVGAEHERGLTSVMWGLPSRAVGAEFYRVIAFY